MRKLSNYGVTINQVEPGSKNSSFIFEQSEILEALFSKSRGTLSVEAKTIQVHRPCSYHPKLIKVLWNKAQANTRSDESAQRVSHISSQGKRWLRGAKEYIGI